MSDAVWQPELDELAQRTKLAQAMGGPDKVKRQHDAGKLTVRERIDQLLDPGTFREIGSLAGKAGYDDDGTMTEFMPANFVFGRGRIDQRPVVVGGDDFTVRGGAADAAIHEKQVQCEQMAHELRLPLVRLVDGTGGGGSVKTLEHDGRTYVPYIPGWEWVAANMSTVPVVSLALGSVAGLGAARTVTSHYSLMVRGQSHMFIAGPPVVSALGTPVTKDELGGADVHAACGAVDDLVDSEIEAFARTRRFLSYLPASVDQLPARAASTDDPARQTPALDSIVPRSRRQVYKTRTILDAVCDQGSVMEIGRAWGKSVITALARLDGWPVAVVASDPYIYGGAWTADSSQKLIRFVELAETFHLPVVHFVDIPGFLIGVQAEKDATIRHGARALSAVHQATVPWCTIVLRKAFGVAAAGMSNHARFRYRYAWPSGDWGSLPIEGGIEAAYKSELEAAADPAAARAAIEERLNRVRSPFRTAERFLVEEIIRPAETRAYLCEFANLAAPLRKPGAPSFGTRP